MNRFLLLCLFVFGWSLLVACRNQAPPAFAPADLPRTEWSEIEARARGTTVNFASWADEPRLRFYRNELAAALREKYDVRLNVVPIGDTAEVVNKLLTEKAAGKNANGSIDVIWINGENFRAAKQADLLWGAFADKLPNLRLYDEQAGKRDFGTAIENLEAPWQRAQFVLAHDRARVASPPRSIEQLGAWIRQNPGKFTYPAPPDFTGSAFVRHVLFESGGGAQQFENNFDEKLYREASAITFEFLREIKPFLWRQGAVYPNTPIELNKLFANQEVEFAMSYSANFAAEAIKRGEFAATVEPFVFDAGTISAYNYLTVPFNAKNSPGALVTINYLMSHENLLAQAVNLGSLYPHDTNKINDAQRRAVESLPRAAATLSLQELAARSVPEADAQYLERLEKDWRTQVLLK